jgi:hypothetical protein
MAQTVEQALSEAVFYTDDEDYCLIRLPARAVTAAASIIAEVGEPFGALIVDKDEVTLMTYSEVADEFRARLKNAHISETIYRLITIDVELEPELIGFMARVSAALAAAGVTILPYAAFSRDHLMVPQVQVKTAIDALEALKSQT